MADGQSRGPASTPPVTPAESVVQVEPFPNELDDDQINLHLMNNHRIRSVVEAYNENVAGTLNRIRNLESRRQAISDRYNEIISSGETVLETRSGTQADAIRARIDAYRAERDDAWSRYDDRISSEQATVKTASDEVEEAIEEILQDVNDRFFDLANNQLNASSSTSVQIRADIAAIDAQITSLERQKQVVQAVNEHLPSTTPRIVPAGDASPAQPLIDILESEEVPPPRTSPGLSVLTPSNWTDVFFDPNSRVNVHAALEGKLQEIDLDINQAAQLYPDEYKKYQKLLGGFWIEDAPIDWWGIASDTMWFILEEAFWVGAGLALAPITGGIGTAILVSARMAKRAGQIGNLVSRAIMAGVRVARWYARLEDRVQTFVFNAFQNAWRRVRARVLARRGRPASQVNGSRQDVDGPTCPIGACVL